MFSRKLGALNHPSAATFNSQNQGKRLENRSWSQHSSRSEDPEIFFETDPDSFSWNEVEILPLFLFLIFSYLNNENNWWKLF